MKKFIFLTLAVLGCAQITFGQSSIPALSNDRVYGGDAVSSAKLQAFIIHYELTHVSPARFFVVYAADTGGSLPAYTSRLIKTWQYDRRFDRNEHIILVFAPKQHDFYIHFGDSWQHCFDLDNDLAQLQVLLNATYKTSPQEIIRILDQWMQTHIRQRREFVARGAARLQKIKALIAEKQAQHLVFSPPEGYAIAIRRFQQIAGDCNCNRVQAAFNALNIALNDTEDAIRAAAQQQAEARLSLAHANAIFGQLGKTFLAIPDSIAEPARIKNAYAEVESLLILATDELPTHYAQSNEHSVSASNLANVLIFRIERAQKMRMAAYTLSIKINDRLENFANMDAHNPVNITFDRKRLAALQDTVKMLMAIQAGQAEEFVHKGTNILEQLDELNSATLKDRTIATLHNYGDLLTIAFFIGVMSVLFSYTMFYHYKRHEYIEIILNEKKYAWERFQEHARSIIDLLNTGFGKLIPAPNGQLQVRFSGQSYTQYKKALSQINSIYSQQHFAEQNLTAVQAFLSQMSPWRPNLVQDAVDYLKGQKIIPEDADFDTFTKKVNTGDLSLALVQIDRLIINLDDYYESAASILEQIREAQERVRLEAANGQVFVSRVRDLLAEHQAANNLQPFYQNRFAELKVDLNKVLALEKTDPIAAVHAFEGITVMLKSLVENLTQIPDFLAESQSLTGWLDDFNQTISQLRDSGLRLREDGGPEPCVESARALLHEGQYNLSQGRITQAKSVFDSARKLLEEANAQISKTIEIKDVVAHQIAELKALNERLYDEIADTMISLADMRKSFKQEAFSLENDHVDESVLILNKCGNLLIEAEMYIQPFMQKFLAAWKLVTEVEQMQHGVRHLLVQVKKRRATLYDLRRETQAQYESLTDFYTRVVNFVRKHHTDLPADFSEFLSIIGTDCADLQRRFEVEQIDWEDFKINIGELEKAILFVFELASQNEQSRISYKLHLQSAMLTIQEVEALFAVEVTMPPLVAQEMYTCAKALLEVVNELGHQQCAEWPEQILLLDLIDELGDRAKSCALRPLSLDEQVGETLQVLEQPENKRQLEKAKTDRVNKMLADHIEEQYRSEHFQDAIQSSFRLLLTAYKEECLKRIEYKKTMRKNAFDELTNTRKATLARAKAERTGSWIRQARERAWYLMPPSFLTTETIVPVQVEEDSDFMEATGTSGLHLV